MMPRGRPRWIEDLDKEQLITLWYDDSLTAAEIAMELGVSASWLC
jgi:DNA-directed RNA polymerase specialized sigma subunit